jgi:hypothetical protein
MRIVRDTRPCHVCGGELLMAVRVPHTMHTATGDVVGTRTITLCRRCHVDDPVAQDLLAFFTVHARIDSDNTAQTAELIRAWVKAVSADAPDHDIDPADIQEWIAETHDTGTRPES